MLVRYTALLVALVGRLTCTALLLLLCTLGCQPEEESAQAKFVALTQQHGIIEKSWLINKVRKSAWKIRYGFSDNKNCNGLFGATARAQLTASITNSLSVWLQALELRGNIVQSFSYERKDTKMTGTSTDSYRKFTYGRLGRHDHFKGFLPDLAIIFYCRYGRSAAGVYENPPTLHMFKDSRGERDRMTQQGSYSITVMLHEIGHAFGLADTYVDETKRGQEQGRYNQSEGGAQVTVGTQPLSVMNSPYLIALFDSAELQIGADDHAGINWLYDFHQDASVSKQTCHTDYSYELNTKGCTPRYPLIFMVKHAGLLAVITLLKEDNTININQQDSRGNTALHYAANLAAQHDHTLYNLLIQYGASDYIRNNNTETAPEILGKVSKRGEADSLFVKKVFIATMFAAVRRGRQQGTTKQKRAATNDAVMHILVKKFISNGNDINMQDKDGKTLLHYAAIHGRLQLLQTLLQQHNLDVNAQARLSEETALHKAARFGQPEVAEALLVNHTGQTALDRTIIYDSNKGETKLTQIIHHVNIDIEDTWGRTALSRALYERVRASNKGETKLAARIKKVAELIRDHERGDEPNTEPDTNNVDSNTCNGNNCGNYVAPPMQE